MKNSQHNVKNLIVFSNGTGGRQWAQNADFWNIHDILLPDCKVWSSWETAQKFVACFLSTQSSEASVSADRRFAHQFALLPTHFSKRGLQIFASAQNGGLQYNPRSCALHLANSMKQQQECESSCGSRL